MKHITVFFLIAVLGFSCSREPESFKGFGGLDIGADFNALPIAKDFTKTMDDEFYIARYALSDNIGEVTNLNVSLYDGKICEVRFVSSDHTNKAEVEKVTANMIKPEFPLKIDFLEIYSSPDQKIMFMIEKGKGTKSEYPKSVNEYRYLNPEAANRNREPVMKSIGKTVSSP